MEDERLYKIRSRVLGQVRDEIKALAKSINRLVEALEVKDEIKQLALSIDKLVEAMEEEKEEPE